MGESSNVGNLVPIQTLDVILFHQRLDVLLNVGDLGREARLDLLDDFLHKLDVFHLLPGFHDTNNGRLEAS